MKGLSVVGELAEKGGVVCPVRREGARLAAGPIVTGVPSARVLAALGRTNGFQVRCFRVEEELVGVAH